MIWKKLPSSTTFSTTETMLYGTLGSSGIIRFSAAQERSRVSLVARVGGSEVLFGGRKSNSARSCRKPSTSLS